uniref:hypothetical protein n=1 Tax=Neisseria leonii TaxID=2995413 RepID=UPI003F588D91
MSLTKPKISDPAYAELIAGQRPKLSDAENALLDEILAAFSFDAVQAQALAQAVLQQVRFDPNALHIEDFDDEDTTGVCEHCLNPPVPPLRDYMMWRQKRG